MLQSIYQVGIVRFQLHRCTFYLCLIGEHLADCEYLISLTMVTGQFQCRFLFKGQRLMYIKTDIFCEAIFVIVAELILLHCSVNLSKYILLGK